MSIARALIVVLAISTAPCAAQSQTELDLDALLERLNTFVVGHCGDDQCVAIRGDLGIANDSSSTESARIVAMASALQWLAKDLWGKCDGESRDLLSGIDRTSDADLRNAINGSLPDCLNNITQFVNGDPEITNGCCSGSGGYSAQSAQPLQERMATLEDKLARIERALEVTSDNEHPTITVGPGERLGIGTSFSADGGSDPQAVLHVLSAGNDKFAAKIVNLDKDGRGLQVQGSDGDGENPVFQVVDTNNKELFSVSESGIVNLKTLALSEAHDSKLVDGMNKKSGLWINGQCFEPVTLIFCYATYSVKIRNPIGNSMLPLEDGMARGVALNAEECEKRLDQQHDAKRKSQRGSRLVGELKNPTTKSLTMLAGCSTNTSTMEIFGGVSQ